MFLCSFAVSFLSFCVCIKLRVFVLCECPFFFFGVFCIYVCVCVRAHKMSGVNSAARVLNVSGLMN